MQRVNSPTTILTQAGGMAVNQASGNNSFSPSEINKDVFFQLEKMSVGGLSQPFIVRAEQNVTEIKLVKLIQRTKPHKASLKTDYDLIQEAALQDKQMNAISSWIEERSADTYINIIDKQFGSCDFMYKWK